MDGPGAQEASLGFLFNPSLTGPVRERDVPSHTLTHTRPQKRTHCIDIIIELHVTRANTNALLPVHKEQTH